MTSTLDSHGIHPFEDPEVEAPAFGTPYREILHSINLRDLGEVTDIVKGGLVFRSSQVVSPSHLRQLHIRVSIDRDKEINKIYFDCEIHERILSDCIRQFAERSRPPKGQCLMPSADSQPAASIRESSVVHYCLDFAQTARQEGKNREHCSSDDICRRFPGRSIPMLEVFRCV